MKKKIYECGKKTMEKKKLLKFVFHQKRKEKKTLKIDSI